MILGFKEKHRNGENTYFPYKIIEGLRRNKMISYNDSESLNIKYFHHSGIIPNERQLPKIHTIREDNANRWHTGCEIDFFVNQRTNRMYKFAPRLKCTRTQTFEIKHEVGHATVFIDRKFFGEIYHHGFDDIYEFSTCLIDFSRNDGFDYLPDFLNWFSKDFKGKIIHWIDFKY